MPNPAPDDLAAPPLVGIDSGDRVAATADPVIGAAGDIACEPAMSSFNGGYGTSANCRQKFTSDLVVNAGLAAVLLLGDNQYYCGGYEAFLKSYDRSWGRVKSISYPAVGNHEYLTSGGTGCSSTNAGARGHFRYFGARAGDPRKGYYSFNIGSWHILLLNSNCSKVGGCSASNPQGQWLRADLAAHRNYCTLAFWHAPLFSSGGRASSTYKTFWDALYQYGADVVLNAHDHIYERFARQTPSGARDDVRGIRQFIVGTGGANHTSLVTRARNSEVRNADTFGVLKMRLRATSYDWAFVAEAGKTFRDSGSTSCHSSGDTVPPAVNPPVQSVLSNTPLGSYTVPVRLAWSGSDSRSGIFAYQLQQSVNGAAWGYIALPGGATTSVTRPLYPRNAYRFRVRARDGAGNWSGWVAGPAFRVTTLDETSTAIAYTPGMWGRGYVKGAWGEYVRFANSAGAKARLSFNGRNIALVSTRAGNRGKATVYIDGSAVATVDLYSSSVRTRYIVFSRSWSSLGTHTIEVRALGTRSSASGGTRVDLDAFVALQ